MTRAFENGALFGCKSLKLKNSETNLGEWMVIYESNKF